MTLLMQLSSQVSTELHDLLYDCERFTLASFSPISHGALHIYYSALPFTPPSLLQRIYNDERGSVKVLSTLPQGWNPWLFSMHGHSDWVMSVAFSPNGNHIASGSRDATIRIWDAKTGVHLTTLNGHSDEVNSVAFSPDGNHIASGSRDATVRIWDAKTGVHLATLKGHSHWVRSVAFSPDGGRIASGSDDKTVRIWDAKTGVNLATLKGHSDPVTSVAFSPDGSRIASHSGGKTVRIWDAKTGAHLSKVRGHTNKPLSSLFSTNGTSNTPGTCSSELGSCEIQLQSPSWLVVSGHINTRVWLPAETYSTFSCHSSYGNSVVVGTDEGILIHLEIPLTTASL
jgi:WD40 repeat protein